MSSSDNRALRERRLAQGLTQGELAARAGVSRQLVAAVEAGRHSPSVEAAIGLARALGLAVEELFCAPDPEPEAAGAVEEGTGLRLAQVGKRLLAHSLPGGLAAGGGWARADATVRDGRLELLAGYEPAALAIAGCDPAIGLAEELLPRRGPESMLAVSMTTGAARRALAAGEVHGAVVHGPARRYPAAPPGVIRVRLGRWRVGLAVGSRRRASLDGLLAGRLPVVQRARDAASQQALGRALRRAGLTGPPAGPRAAGHIAAARTAAERDLAALTTESAARAFGLRFLPLETHEVEVWLAAPWASLPAAEAFRGVLASAAFTERVSLLGGYDLTGCGVTV